MLVITQNPTGGLGIPRSSGGGAPISGGAVAGGGMPIPASSGGGVVPSGFHAPTGGGALHPAFHAAPVGHGHHGHRRHHHGGIYPWFPYYYYPYAYYYPNYYAYQQPAWYQPQTCPAPLSDDCRELQPTARWATSCFLPRFRYLRNVYGSDYERLASALAREEAPWCAFPARSGAAAEYERRIKLAVAVLLNAEGSPVPYPPPPPTPRPRDADAIRQPWMRALLTGWT